MHDRMMELVSKADQLGFKAEFLEFFFLILSYVGDEVGPEAIESQAEYAYGQTKQKYSPQSDETKNIQKFD